MVNLKCPDAGSWIQDTDQDELTAGCGLNNLIVDVDDGAFQDEGDPLFLIQRNGNPRDCLSAGRAETDRKKLWNLAPEFQKKAAASLRNKTFHIRRSVIFGYGAVIMV